MCRKKRSKVKVFFLCTACGSTHEVPENMRARLTRCGSRMVFVPQDAENTKNLPVLKEASAPTEGLLVGVRATVIREPKPPMHRPHYGLKRLGGSRSQF